MNQPHLSDQTLQLLASQSAQLQPEEETHLQSCAQCAAQVTAYTTLFGELKQLPEAHFSFDVEALAMEKIPVAREHRSDRWWIWLPILIVIPVAAAIGYFLHQELQQLFTGLPVLEIILALVACCFTVGLGGFDLIRSYNQRLKKLENNFPSAT
ncbi:MAG: hypothetical protein JNL59_08565 [Chitinophagaceae bacterium]|nr:hypothetical protein [Chitinophagaceae bacterium]